ncbi:MAG: fumarate hydratase [Oscillospiraceae bacterium]|jgi:fumarate hydratase subunit alpha|nr:fumarate hydratase [Oscillospiraceae bacterium]
MRIIRANEILELTRRLILDAEFNIGVDIRAALEAALRRETTAPARLALEQILENQRIASEERTPMCQDTGMIIVFAELGQDVHIESDAAGGFEDAVQAGARAAFRGGYLRASVVDDPLFDRTNTRDNSPAVIHTRVVDGDRLRLVVIPKGFGSENMSAVRMFPPSAGRDGVADFIVDTVRRAGSKPCPPTIVGVGVGGTFEQCAMIAKMETARRVGSVNPDMRYAKLEEECLERINALGIGPAGYGGATTSLAVHIGHAPTHIAGMPTAVNIACHASRHAEGSI